MQVVEKPMPGKQRFLLAQDNVEIFRDLACDLIM